MRRFLLWYGLLTKRLFRRVSFWVLLLSWVIQGAAVVLLGRFCAAVYGALLIHRGEKIKLKQLLSIFREQKGVRA